MRGREIVREMRERERERERETERERERERLPAARVRAEKLPPLPPHVALLVLYQIPAPAVRSLYRMAVRGVARGQAQTQTQTQTQTHTDTDTDTDTHTHTHRERERERREP